jgi:hypothetical protein
MTWYRCGGGASGGDAANITELCCLKCYGAASVGIPGMQNLAQYNDYAAYLSYNTSTYKFDVIKDFTALVTGWVYSYDRASSTYSEGRTYVNGVEKLSYQVDTIVTGDTAGQTGIFTLKAGDTIYPYTPSRNGYPQQYMKIYKFEPFVEVSDAVLATYLNVPILSDEGAI